MFAFWWLQSPALARPAVYMASQLKRSTVLAVALSLLSSRPLETLQACLGIQWSPRRQSGHDPVGNVA